MFKKIFISFLFSLLVVCAFAQYPSTFPLSGSNTTTMQTSAGGLAPATLKVPTNYTDTTAANTNGKVNKYAGSIIHTNDDKTWIRNITATKWLQFSTGGSAGFPVDSVVSVKIGCLDFQSYYSGGVATVFDTIQLYDGILIPGVVTQTSTLSFDVTRYIYRLNCHLYQTPLDTSVTVSAPDDSLLRIDYIGGDTLNKVKIIEGTPSNSATAPDYDIHAFMPFAQVFVSADTTYIIPIPPNLDGRYVKIAIPDTITAQKTFRDTLRIGPYPLASDNLIIHAGTVINQFAYAIDTIALQQVRANWYEYIVGTKGQSIPQYSKKFDGINGTVLTLNADKTVAVGNGMAFPGGTPFAMSGGGSTIQIQSTNNSTARVSIPTLGAPLQANAVSLLVPLGGGENGSNSAGGYFTGSAGLPLLRIDAGQHLGIGTITPDVNSSGDIGTQLPWLNPRMSTAVRDGLGNWVQTVLVTNGGSGYLTVPTVSIVGVIGRQPRFSVTISGGQVISITINYPGTGIPASGALVFNNTGTGGTGATGTFTRSTGNPIPTWGTIINTDSTDCPIETYNGSSWIGACGTTGGGGGSLQDAITVSGVLNINNTITNGANTLTINSNDGTDASSISISGTAIDLTVNGNSGSASTLEANALRTQMSFGISGPTNVLNMDASGTTFESSLDGAGIKYLSDYSAGFTNRSLVDKEYVDNAVIGGGGITIGTTTVTSGTNTRILFDNSGVVGEYTISGTGNVAMTTSPTFTTPALGTPSSGTLTNTTGFPLANLAGAGTGVLTFLATPSSANLAAAVTGETGSGALVFGTSPTLATPVINVGSDATGDIYYRNAGVYTRLPIGSTNDILTVSGGLPSWQAGTSTTSDTLSYNNDQFHIRKIRANYDSAYIVGTPTGIFFAGADSAMTTDPNLVWTGSDLNINGGIFTDAGASTQSIISTENVVLGSGSGTGIVISGASSVTPDIVTINAVNAVNITGGSFSCSVGGGPQTLQTIGDLTLGDLAGNVAIVVSGSNNDNTVYVKGSNIQFSDFGAGAITSDASGNLTSVSDERLKNILGYSHTGLNAVMNLKPINFKYNSKYKGDHDSTYTGFSAQNVKANIPNGTGVTKDGYLTLQDRSILAAAIVAIQEQQKEIEQLKKQINDNNTKRQPKRRSVSNRRK